MGSMLALVLLAPIGGAEGDRVTTRLTDFSTLDGWTSSRTGGRLKSEFHHYTFEPTDSAGRDGKGLCWRFRTRKQTYSDLFLRGVFDEPFDRIAVWVRNPKRTPAAFWFKLTETTRAEHMHKPAGGATGVRLDTTDQWQRVELELSDYVTASWSKDENGRIDFPLAAIGLVCWGVKPGEDYELHFDDLEVSRPRPKRVRLASAPTPKSVPAGRPVDVRLTVVPEEKLGADADLVLTLCRNGRPLAVRTVKPPTPARGWPVGKPVVLPAVQFPIAVYAPGGRYEVRARLGWTPLRTKDGAVAAFDVIARQPGPLPVTSVRTHNGVPTLHVNGEPNAGMTYMTYNRQATKHFASFGKAGVNLASFSATSDLSFYNLAPPTWLAPGRFDYSAFDKRMVEVLEANPNALVIPRVYMSAPEWWSKAHPDQVVRQHDGTVWNPARPVASWASDLWRRDAGIALARFIRHVRSSPYADHVIGYHIACGHTEEWFWWGFWAKDFLDYSEPARRRFAAWLHERDKTVNPAAVRIPTKAERTAADVGLLRLPAKSGRVIAFNAFHNDLVVDTIEHFASIVKREVEGKQLCGVFYGYMFELNASPEGGHNALGRLLRCRDVDFLTAPSSYGFRKSASGYSTFMSATASIKRHGKLWFDENDYRTHLSGGSRRRGTKTLAETIEVQRRELVNVLCHGTAKWWFDMGGGWYDQPELMAAIGQMNRIAERSVAFDRSSVAEVALVIDAASTFHTQDRHAMGRLAVNRQRLGLGHMGAPFDVILLDDLGRTGPYKLYVFVNAYHLPPAKRAMIDRRVKREGRTALWVYTAGAVDPEGVEPVVGMHLACDPKAAALRLEVTDTTDAITRRLKAGASWGAPNRIAPVYSCDDPRATVLGVLKGSGKPGLAVRRFTDWTSIYCAAPNLPAWLMREIARSAGVHIYNERDEALYASRSLLGLQAHKGGPRRLRFPHPVDLYDLFGERQAARGVREFTVDLAPGQTALYFLGAQSRWKRPASATPKP